MKKFREIITRFLEYNTAEGYEKDVEIFKNYINSIGIKDESVIPYLQGIRTKEIIQSLNYYIEMNSITSIDTALRYCSCIKEFLSFLMEKEIIINHELTKEIGLPAYSDKSFRYKVNNYINSDKRLKERKDFVAFDENEIMQLIRDCDEAINPTGIEKASIQKMYFNRIRATVIIKLIIFCGIRYEHLHEIKYSDIDLVQNTITINGFILHLPHNLRNQLSEYEGIISNIEQQEKREYFFINFDGGKISEQTSSISGHLKNYTGRRDLNGIIKYSVINMIRKGINESIIKKLTGIESTMYNPCQKFVNDELSVNTNRYLDSKLRSIHTFDAL